MRKALGKRLHRGHSIRRRLPFIFVLIGLIAGGLCLNWYMISNAQAQVASAEAAHAKVLQNLDDEIVAIEARKAAEEEARKVAAAKETAQTVIETPESQAGTIDAASCNVSGRHNNPEAIDVVVNKKHCIQPLTYAPSDLVTVYGATLSAKASDAFAQLFKAAEAAGQPITVTSSYRSYSNQVTTYNYWVGVSGADGADTYSARPGYSEHQTGFVVDIASASGCSLDCFGSTTQYQWMQQNATTYGFIQRYYDGYDNITGYTGEEWHYRYVGVATATDMKAKGVLSLEEYWDIPGGTY